MRLNKSSKSSETIVLPAQVRLCARQWFGLAWRVLRDADAAEDICQQAVLKACEHGDGWRDIHAFRAWMSRVITNKAIDELRRRQRERVLHRNHAYSQSGATTADPDEAFALREALQQALDTLPPEAREVAAMRLVAGLNGNETAEALGISVATVSRRFHQSMTLLREQLADWQPEMKGGTP